jgi:hypothetical protein
LCAIPREQLRIDDLSQQIETEGTELPLEQLGSDTWQLESTAVLQVLARIREVGVPLTEFNGAKPYRGILTGCNMAYLIDTPTRDHLSTSDPKCANLIRPYVRGQDIDRWCCDWSELWMIAVKSSGDFRWPWSEAGPSAEATFRESYPSLYHWFQPMEDTLRNRQDKGRHWWELRACAYWDQLDHPKIVYQEIQFHPRYAFDESTYYGNNKTFFIPSSDLYLLAVLNSPLMWWHNWRYLPHMKDEALSPVAFLMESLPIAQPDQRTRSLTEAAVTRTIEIASSHRSTRRVILDWLRVEYEIAKPTLKLQSAIDLDSDGFVAEVRKVRGKKKPLTAAGLKALRDEYTRSIEPARRLAAEALVLEYKISDLVNAAYGLTPEETALMWDTAPPRMPLPGPKKPAAT